MKKLNKKSLIAFLCLIISIICLLSFNYFNVGAVTVSPIALNEKRSVSIRQGIPRYYSYEITDNKYYVVETRGSVGTYISVSGLSSGTVSNGEGGVGTNARVGFVGEAGKTITITVMGSMPTDSGTTKLQIRRQQAVLYGFKYPNSNNAIGIDTRTDLDTPYSCLSDKYYTYKYTDSTITSSHMLNNDERGYSRLNSEIVFFSGHGYDDGSGVVFPSSSVSVTNLKNMENVKVAVWAACYSSKMAQGSIDAGAKSSIGWSESIGTSSSKTFTDRLFIKLAEGSSIEEAAEYAKNGISNSNNTIRNYKIAGNATTTIAAWSVTKAMQISDKSLIEEFQSRTADTENWDTHFYDDGSYVVSRTINNWITNDFYDVVIRSDGTNHVTHSGVKFDGQTVLPARSFKAQTKQFIEANGIKFNKLIKTEKINYYYICDNVATPIEINFNTYVSDSGICYQDVVCINLNDGSNVDYDTISTVGKNE